MRMISVTLIALILCQPFLPADSASAQDGAALADAGAVAPFRKRGYLLTDPDLRLSDDNRALYLKLVRDFPDAESCLVATDAPLPLEQRLLNWKKVDRTEKLEVCVFNIASELGSVAGIHGWFSANGFGNEPLLHHEIQVSKLYGIEGEAIILNSNMSRNEIPAGFGGLLRGLYLIMVYGMGVAIILSPDEKPVDVDVGLSRL